MSNNCTNWLFTNKSKKRKKFKGAIKFLWLFKLCLYKKEFCVIRCFPPACLVNSCFPSLSCLSLTLAPVGFPCVRCFLSLLFTCLSSLDLCPILPAAHSLWYSDVRDKFSNSVHHKCNMVIINVILNKRFVNNSKKCVISEQKSKWSH